MKKISCIAVIAGAILTVGAARMVTAEEPGAKPDSPPAGMPGMMKMMGGAHPMHSSEAMGSMMERMQGMDMTKMMERCREMMSEQPAAETKEKR